MHNKILKYKFSHAQPSPKEERGQFSKKENIEISQTTKDTKHIFQKFLHREKFKILRL